MALVAAILVAAFVLPTEWGIPLVVAGIVIEIGETWFWWKLSHRRRPVVGVETLVGATATVVVPCRPRGQVRVGGELWGATCPEGAEEGEAVKIVAVDGLELVVSR
jgi:membrane protein implicated in regulation of membrane protease activity